MNKSDGSNSYAISGLLRFIPPIFNKIFFINMMFFSFPNANSNNKKIINIIFALSKIFHNSN